ncbi:MAG TPA: hypothetical protein VE961_27675 [Pyrinomonadaceae bacterium]|nr:hypothetical protein [Pyrinomonadaceae bacterium]
MIFGNRTIPRHLLRGALGLTALYIAASTFHGTTWRALLFLALALILLKGCPMCWTLGLIETIAMAVHRRNEQKCCGYKQQHNSVAGFRLISGLHTLHPAAPSSASAF